jgi:succinate dehydrogenase hydrophobic anchor subunit
VATAIAAAIVAPRAAAHAGSLSLKDVMHRVGAYVDAYGDRASIVVCTEQYEQHADGSNSVAQTRTLVSDFALVYADAIHGWLGFRDVIEVNDRAVQDREDRLAHVLMGAQGRFDEARRLSDEGARFNLGNLQRNFNVPTSALFFFVTENHDRFKFSARRVLDDGTWEIAFRETGKPAMIRTPEGEPVTTTGTLWVRPEDGVVVRTMLEVDVTMHRLNPLQRGKGSIDVSYRLVDTLGTWLPASMDEAFAATRQDAWDKVTGHAEYSNYRRFETSGRIKK